MSVARLAVPEPPGRREMLEMLDGIRQRVENGEIVSLLVLAVGVDSTFDTYSTGDIPVTQRIGYMMCHVNDLVRSMEHG
jgi:hypothetical protein